MGETVRLYLDLCHWDIDSHELTYTGLARKQADGGGRLRIAESGSVRIWVLLSNDCHWHWLYWQLRVSVQFASASLSRVDPCLRKAFFTLSIWRSLSRVRSKDTSGVIGNEKHLEEYQTRLGTLARACCEYSRRLFPLADLVSRKLWMRHGHSLISRVFL